MFFKRGKCPIDTLITITKQELATYKDSAFLTENMHSYARDQGTNTFIIRQVFKSRIINIIAEYFLNSSIVLPVWLSLYETVLFKTFICSDCTYEFAKKYYYFIIMIVNVIN